MLLIDQPFPFQQYIRTMKNSWTATSIFAGTIIATGFFALYRRSLRRRQECWWSNRNRPLVRLSNQAKPEDVVAVLQRDGAVIVEGLVSKDTVDQLSRDILSLSHTEYSGAKNSFAGQHTRRCGPYILSHSAAARELVAHPLHVAVSSRLLEKTARRIRLSTVACIRVFAGQTAQVLHRDDDEWPLSLLGQIDPGLEIECSAMWAVTDFRETNGATNVVVGSHGRHDDDEPPLDQCQQAVMSPGSVLFFTGSVWHGTGAASECDEKTGRMGFLVQHIAGFLHPEYNLHFAIDPKMSKTFDGPLRSLLGFDGPDLFPKAELPGPVYATEYIGYPDREDADFSAPLTG